MHLATRTELYARQDVRLSLWELPPDSAIGFHRHEVRYCVVPVTGGTLTVVDGDGNETLRDTTTGAPYVGPAGTAHDVQNRSSELITFLECEFLER